MSSPTIEIVLRRADRVYHENDFVTGVLIISSNTDLKHDGIMLTMEGLVNLQISSKNVGILEAFYNSVKPIQLLGTCCEISAPGRFPSGVTQIPFEIPLKAKPNRVLYETYHGVYVNISYSLKCDIKRSFLSKDIQKIQQFLVQYKPGLGPGLSPLIKESRRPVTIKINPSTLSTGGAGAPDFFLRGQLYTTYCNITEPFTGYLVLERCEIPVRSLELQLVRVETCGCAEGFAKEPTEIQNIQIGDGDIPQNVDIPVYMIFPRLFTCPTLIAHNFKIEFEINIVIIFQNDHLVTNNFPIILVRE